MHRARQNSLFGLILALGLTLGFGLVCGHGAQAQSAPSPAADAAADAPADMLSVAMAGFTLLPVMADDGTQARDDTGQPLFQRRPLADSVVTPGDAILYVIRVENSTAAPAENLQIGAQVAPELLFDPYSVAGPDAQALRMALEWADAETPDQFRPVFVLVDGQPQMQADLATLRALRFHLPFLPVGGMAEIEYTVTLR
jgi:uncharacterized repeat protein (TIGR01451 family)